MKNVILAVSITAIFFLGSCKPNHSEESAQEYAVIELKPSEIEISESYSASVRGRQDIDIYPQVSGAITQVSIREGQQVKKGQSLFTIDQIPYQAELQTAIANLNAAKANTASAELTYNSKKELFAQKVISDYELLNAENALLTAKAQQEQAEAQLANARNNYTFTEVRSPTDGVVGTLPYRVGALVNPQLPQPLTTVSDNSQMYVYFSMTENQLRSNIRQFGSLDEALANMPAVSMILNDGSTYDQPGRIESISGVINSQTGTVSLRSVFPNEGRLLFSGGMGNIIIPHKLQNVLSVPQSATFEIQDKIFVYKVIEGKAVATQIMVESLNDGMNYIVRSGVQSGDTIVAEGVGLLQDGAEISIKQN
jgi:membrane fusion protein (multidrug efflux system)